MDMVSDARMGWVIYGELTGTTDDTRCEMHMRTFACLKSLCSAC